MMVVALGLLSRVASGGQQRDVEKPKPASATLAGRVTALDTGKPVRRAVVTISAPDLSPNPAVSTDADGTWRFTGLPPSRYTISVAKPGYVTRLTANDVH